MATVIDWASCLVKGQSASSACASDGANGRSGPALLRVPVSNAPTPEGRTWEVFRGYDRDSDSHGSDLKKALHFTEKREGQPHTLRYGMYDKQKLLHIYKHSVNERSFINAECLSFASVSPVPSWCRIQTGKTE